MAIEVVKEPTESKFPLMVGCKHCHAELKIGSLHDILYAAGNQREPDPTLWINCLRCSNRITLPPTEFTSYDLIRIEQRAIEQAVNAYYDELR